MYASVQIPILKGSPFSTSDGIVHYSNTNAGKMYEFTEKYSSRQLEASIRLGSDKYRTEISADEHVHSWLRIRLSIQDFYRRKDIEKLPQFTSVPDFCRL